MKIFNCTCPTRNTLFFENSVCTVCDRKVGYSWENHSLIPEDEIGNELQHCKNRTEYGVCNCYIEDSDDSGLCASCRLNETVPDLSIAEHLPLWQKLEQAKRRCLVTVSDLGLSFSDANASPPLRFSFLADAHAASHFSAPMPGVKRVLTGHNDGLITLNIAEADEVARARAKDHLGESYRTLLGHFRHEIGHYYWTLLIPESAEYTTQFRALFGDEQVDYGESLQHHYDHGAPKDWRNNFISEYATMHPWEDWAETWAHYLHMFDSLQTASQYNYQVALPGSDALNTSNLDLKNFESLYNAWVPFSISLNSLNRSMGHSDAYPFVLSEPVKEKLRFIHGVVAGSKS